MAGLVSLAGGLYALQWLRVRYREVRVITTMFWSEALQEAPARAFRQRFRHLPAYLLILTICALIWVAMAGPQWTREEGAERYVLLLDGSANMARGDRFSSAVSALERDARRLDIDSREVLWVGGSVKPLLAPGEQTVLLGKRLEHLAPQAAPASMDQALSQLASILHTGGKTLIRIYGDAPVSPLTLKLMPASHVVVRATAAPRSQDEEPNAGITTLGIAEASSGRWSKVDVLVHAQRTTGEAVELTNLAMHLDGQPLNALAIEKTAAGAFLLKDLPAAGGLLEVKLDRRDALALDDEASVRLPRRPLIRVLLSPSLQSVLAGVLAADPAIERTAENPDVVIRREGENLGDGRSTLVFVPMASQSAAFSLTWPQDSDAAGEDADGRHQIDASALAQVARRPIELVVKPGPLRVFAVWQELLVEDFNFTRSRSFPLFIAESVRWLAHTPAWYPYVAAGEPLPPPSGTERAPFVNAMAFPIDTMRSAFVPEQAGDLPDASGIQPLHAALLDANTTLSRSGSVNAIGRAGALSPAHAFDPVTVLLLLAFLLLGGEWFLNQRGRVP